MDTFGFRHYFVVSGFLHTMIRIWKGGILYEKQEVNTIVDRMLHINIFFSGICRRITIAGR